MRHDRFEDKLRAARLSEPGIGLDQVKARVPRRSRFTMGRLAVAAAAVWAIAVLSQISVDHQLNVLSPAPVSQRVVDSAAPSDGPPARWLLVSNPELLDAWLAGEPIPAPSPREPADGDDRQSSSGRPLIGRLNHV